MTILNLENVLAQVKPIVTNTSTFIKSQVHKVTSKDIETKELNSLVSYVDKEAEIMLVSGIKSIIPEANFITEEETIENKKGRINWIIDPLDGTTNYLNGIPHFAISIALQVDGIIVLGIVHEVNSKDTWTAIKGKGAYYNDRKCHVNKNDLSNVLIATGFPYHNDYDYDSHFTLIKYWLTNSRGLRRMGSAALDLCYVAIGRFGVYYEGDLNAWDVAAGALIVEESGGVVTDYDGGNSFVEKQQIFAASPSLHQRTLSIIRENLL